MKRPVLRVRRLQDGTVENTVEPEVEVGEGFESFNAAIDALVGEVVGCEDGAHVLWCDEMGLFHLSPLANAIATRLAGRPIVGDCILFRDEDLE
jgi:hypothetical protein